MIFLFVEFAKLMCGSEADEQELLDLVEQVKHTASQVMPGSTPVTPDTAT